MSLQRGIGGEPVRSESVTSRTGRYAQRRSTDTRRLAEATLACPTCDAPVALTTGPVAVTSPLACPFCARAGTVRDFLSLRTPTRPARVVIRVTARWP